MAFVKDVDTLTGYITSDALAVLMQRCRGLMLLHSAGRLPLQVVAIRRCVLASGPGEGELWRSAKQASGNVSRACGG